MGFYQELSRHYDEVFPVNAEEMRLVSTWLEGRKRLLDIGCGTGNKTAHFAAEGRNIVAVDLDAGMIERAARDHAAPGIDYRLMDMTRIAEDFAPGRFDAVLCLGNTLPHLTAAGAVERFLSDTAMVLGADGLLVLQTVNYDRIVDQGVDSLPLIDTPAVKFVRRYVWRGGEMHFVTELTAKAGGERFENDVVLRPLRKAELASALEAAGFGDVTYFGNYAGAPYAENAFHLIALARRR